ncbi:MAG: alpha-1,4-glucan--maltose-1-phosphate maltosyltransferase, partial [Actinomycetota bacterium]
PELGSLDDFRRFCAEARDRGLEVALDYALQCSPDHPWVTEHPEWFWRRPDGSIRYAENPPKKYQDIYPLNFWPQEPGERERMWNACKDIVAFWLDRGVKVFRVDNPHTKPFAFWEWMIPEIQRQDPEVIFLAEAFTRPKIMSKLAEIGFTQSYTYFTWRTAKAELTDYLNELALGPKADYMRPNFWTNTPDILSGPLRSGPPAVFKLRLALAATMTPSYGMYSGYELCENEPASDHDEEYLNSEKYEVKRRDFNKEPNLISFVTRLNDIRRAHPAFSQLRRVRFHDTGNDRVIAFSKASQDLSDIVLTAVSLDPYEPQHALVALDSGAWGEPSPGDLVDEISGARMDARDGKVSLSFDPAGECAAIMPLPPAGAV